MPSCPVHLKVACILCDRLGVYNKADFMLGAISPDCVNLKGFASQQVRYAAHLRDKDYSVWKKKLSDYYAQNKMKYVMNLDFLKGYIFHCITDIAWDEVVQPQLFEFLEKEESLTKEELTKNKWEELFRFNSQLVNEDWYYGAVLLAMSGKPQDIASVKAKMIDDYRKYVANDYKDKVSGEKSEFLCDKHVNECADRTLALFGELIR